MVLHRTENSEMISPFAPTSVDASKSENDLPIRTKEKQLYALVEELLKQERDLDRVFPKVMKDFCETFMAEAKINPENEQLNRIALLLLRNYGTPMCDSPRKERTDLLLSTWKELQNLGLKLDVNHYNTLLRVFIQNGHSFSSKAYIEDMKKSNIEPNQLTYQGLISASSHNGNIKEALELINIMKNQDFSLSEDVFNSLIIGYAKAGDLESTKGIFGIMKSMKLKPSADTYTALLCAYAESDNMEKLDEVKEITAAEPLLLTFPHLLIIFVTFIRCQHLEQVNEEFFKFYMHSTENIAVEVDIYNNVLFNTVRGLVSDKYYEGVLQLLEACGSFFEQRQLARLYQVFLHRILVRHVEPWATFQFLERISQRPNMQNIYIFIIRHSITRKKDLDFILPALKCLKRKDVKLSKNIFNMIKKSDIFLRFNEEDADMIRYLANDLRDNKEIRREKQEEINYLKKSGKAYTHSLGFLMELSAAENNIEQTRQLKDEYESLSPDDLSPVHLSVLQLSVHNDSTKDVIQLMKMMEEKCGLIFDNTMLYRNPDLCLTLLEKFCREKLSHEAFDLAQKLSRTSSGKRSSRRLFDMFLKLAENESAFRDVAPVILMCVSEGVFEDSVLARHKQEAQKIAKILKSGDEVEQYSAFQVLKYFRYDHFTTFSRLMAKLIIMNDVQELNHVKRIDKLLFGHNTMLVSLGLAYLDIKWYAKCREILQTCSGIQSKDTIFGYLSHLIKYEQQEKIQQLIKATANIKSFTSKERDYMYMSLIRIAGNNWQKCLEIWDMMQDEELIASNTTMKSMAQVLINNKQVVPFSY